MLSLVIQAYNTQTRHMLRLWIRLYTCQCDTYSIHVVLAHVKALYLKRLRISGSRNTDARTPAYPTKAYVYLAYATHTQVYEALR